MLLAPHAIYSLALASAQGSWSTTIVGSAPGSLAVLARAVGERGPAAVCCFIAPVVALFARGKVRQIAVAGTLALVLFLLTPFAYSNDLPQLALGWSLRYNLAELAIGALCLAPLARRFPIPFAILAVISALAGFARLLFILNHEPSILIAFVVSVLMGICVIVAFMPQARAAGGFIAAGIGIALLLYGSRTAYAHAPESYAIIAPRISGNETAFFSWFHAHPHDAESINLRAGALLMLAPASRIFDTDDVACARAALEDALIVVGKGDARAEAARSCGRVAFEDADFIAVLPR
jgi:hypothetical protein